jgi:ABC-type nitrate/sulfonate/bicarbonate transport system permease component
MFASLILISLFGLALFGTVSAVSRLAMPWQSEPRA